MTPDESRALPLVLLALLLALPAQAQLRRTGQMSWSFDDMTINSGAGRTHASQWGQSYKLDLDGPMLSPNIGTFRAGGGYTSGASISQAVNTSIPHVENTTFATSADFFNTALRRFIHFSPNYSRSYLHFTGEANGAGYVNTVANTAWGFDTGLSLPKLPALGYSRQINNLRNPSDVSPVNQKSTTENRTATYSHGHITTNASQQIQNIQDLQGLTAPQQTDYRQASIEGNYYQPKRVPLESFYFRGDVSQNSTNGILGQQQGIGTLGLFTKKFRTGRWDNALSYGAEVSRDALLNQNRFSQNAAINSSRPAGVGTLTNSITATHAPMLPSESVGESLALTTPLRRGAANMIAGASGGWSRNPASTLLSDGLNARFELFPARPLNYFAEARTTGFESQRGTGGSRTNRFGAGVNHRGVRLISSGRLDRTQSRYYDTGSASTSDQLSLDSRGRVLPQLFASGGYNLGLVRAAVGPASVSHNLHGSLDWTPTSGLQVSAAATWVGTGYTGQASISYHLGKTSLSVTYDYKQIAAPATYSHLNISLSRQL